MHEPALSAYLEPVVLADGAAVVVRAIRADDKARLADHFAGLGADSIHHRFFGAKRELSAKELADYTEVDFTTHVALVATELAHGEERIVGVGRYYARGARAEVAFAVIDAYQGRGVATLLLEHLARIARRHGVELFEADVLVDNQAMLHVFAGSGFVVRSRDQDVVHVVFPTAATAAAATAERDRLTP